jgi:hypothetical protein
MRRVEAAKFRPGSSPPAGWGTLARNRELLSVVD